MDEPAFWEWISKLDWSKTGDDDAVLEPLIAGLARLEAADMFRFDDILAEKLHALDGERYARDIGEHSYDGEEEGGDGGYFSADFFLYSRCAAVIDGREAYARVLAEPALMPKDTEFEAILYAAQKAFGRRFGKPYTHVPKPDHETFANRAGWEGE